MLELFVIGHEEDELAMQRYLDVLQRQVNRKYNADYARVMYYKAPIGSTKTEEELRQGMIENSKCAYFVYLDYRKPISDTFVNECVSNIKKIPKVHERDDLKRYCNE
jgi:hypothetical protein